MTEPTLPGFLSDSVGVRMFDKIFLKEGGGPRVGGKSKNKKPCYEGQGMEGGEKEDKPALDLSSGIPKP